MCATRPNGFALTSKIYFLLQKQKGHAAHCKRLVLLHKYPPPSPPPSCSRCRQSHTHAFWSPPGNLIFKTASKSVESHMMYSGDVARVTFYFFKNFTSFLAIISLLMAKLMNELSGLRDCAFQPWDWLRSCSWFCRTGQSGSVGSTWLIRLRLLWCKYLTSTVKFSELITD